MRHETEASVSPRRANGDAARASGPRRPAIQRQAGSFRLAWGILLSIQTAPRFGGSSEPARMQPRRGPSRAVGGHKSVDTDDRFTARHSDEAQCYWPEAE